MSPRAAYAACMVAALVAALAFRRRPVLPWRKQLALTVGAICGAALGAKLPFLLMGQGWLDDGKTILAGMAGGYLGVELAKLAAGVRQKTGDGFAPALAFAVAIGRLGCLFGG